MKLIIACLSFIVLSFNARAQQGYSVREVPFTDVKIKDSFWSKWLTVHATKTIPAVIAQIRDSTNRIANFERAAAQTQGGKKGKFRGIFFDDSDVYKVMEGISYSLQSNPNPETERIMDYWIDIMAMAQLPDGYLYTYFILDRDKDSWEQKGRWTDIGRHEMYTGGHMIEAAIAYYKATGKRKFLDVAIKYVDHWLSLFGPGKRHWVEGHQEAEIALVKLYHLTNDKKYLDFAHWLLEERGHGYEFGPMVATEPASNVNIQNDLPVKDIKNASGHAVRAMYMYSGMADIVANTGDSTYVKALSTVWEDIVYRNMYITGGIGSSPRNEGFVADYDLPNKTAYCETCASVGMVLWNKRMNMMFGDAKYASVMERSLYNGVLAGVSLSGDKFFYVNPLESDGDHHRQWFHGAACCPTNIARLLPSIGSYIYMTKQDELFINLFVGSETNIKFGETQVAVSQETLYPYDGTVLININPASAVDGKINIRVPEWCKKYSVQLNGKTIKNSKAEEGYIQFSRKWSEGDKIILKMDMPVEIVTSDPNVKTNIGKRALQRGPLVYAAEQVDNPGVDLDKIKLSAKNKFTIVDAEGALKGMKKIQTMVGKNKITFIPYYAWDNREAGKMLVWMNYN